ncbi:putative SWI/SNF-related matrix-associated actin-dependent regulator of chromatin subfamily A member 3-like 1 [Momordica charantia]|uniref:SWI/SNF-related matrix-associated actin-dependent regulator of chromatin subfamily A member 3-like 1 n=1 Tax=Momordica charantia TaxID=3673 RepID=A0A6J1DEP0_MOMCH|nr:putative SWI/SNF-related matrix-associated actin-dependent regulator of chromatin subfamily A member 3-like 1 [Momordica charantia]XP_022151984.1 putative SWI/SNF-related matrix-associated actin-dependent regulator of chromatin subfamily A member 3-like 1 [Momordica charantia]
MYYQLAKFSHQDSLEVLEADIQYANSLAAAIPMAKGGPYLQMKLAYNQLAPIVLFLLQWMDCSCTCLLPRYLNLFHILVYKVYPEGKQKGISRHGRKATIRDFYAIILPSLQRIHGSLDTLDDCDEGCHWIEIPSKKRGCDKEGRLMNIDMKREDECGICLEPCTKMVLPNCCHAMCIKCYRNWNTRSESCPFCRGSLKRVNSEDLWVLTCNDDVVDAETASKEDMLRFHRYINSLPKDYPDALFVVYSEYLI